MSKAFFSSATQIWPQDGQITDTKNNKTNIGALTLKRQPHKMVKHTQTIHGLLPTSCLSRLDHFVRLTLKGLNPKNQSSSIKLNGN